jgi:hypothetical protein
MHRRIEEGTSELGMIDQGSVVTAIDLAFRETTRPDCHSLVVGAGPEELQIRDLLLNRQWSEVDTAMLDTYDDRADLSAIVAFLSPKATVYFMPAFLKYVVSKGRSNGLLLRNILRRFTAGKGSFDPTSYSVIQREAISRAMAYMEQVYEGDDEYDLALVRECREAWSHSLARLGAV